MMKKDAKIYVAGHRGLVGSAIVRKLKRYGYTNLVCRSRKQLDLTSQASVDSFFEQERPVYVFLAAAKVGGILANSLYPADFIRDNILIQTSVIQAAYRWSVKRLLFLGSSCIYPKMAPQPIKESHLMTGPLEPTNSAYAVAKISGVEMCWAYNRQHGTLFLPVMPTNLYGPGDSFDLENSHVLPALIRKFHLAKLASQGNRAALAADERHFGDISKDIKKDMGLTSGKHSETVVNLWGSGTPRREFLHVDDLAEACVFLMALEQERLLAGNTSAMLFNIGVGTDVTVKALAEMIRRIVGFKGDIVHDTSKPDGTPQKLLDVSLIHALGWSAKIQLEEGIRQTYEWYRNQIAAE